MMRFTRLETTVITMDATMAVMKESILNPPTMLEAIKRRIALMINIKSPRVRMVAGSVNMTRMGLRSRFRIARTAAMISAVVKESIRNPGTM